MSWQYIVQNNKTCLHHNSIYAQAYVYMYVHAHILILMRNTDCHINIFCLHSQVPNSTQLH